MRRRVVLLMAATSSVIVLAFVVPLSLLLRTVAEDRAVSAATQEAQSLAVLTAAVTDPAEIPRLVSLVEDRSPRVTTVLLADGTVFGAPVGDDPNVARAQAGEAFTDITSDGASVYAPVVTGGGTAVVRSVVLGDDLHRGVGRATLTVAALAVLLLVAAVVAADRLAVWVARPVRDLATAADALRAGHLETRVPERGPPEVVASASALNRLAARIGELLAAERDAVADLSHRLRTPITALRLDAEGLSTSKPEEAERVRVHVTSLERTVDAIVRDARRPVRASVDARCDATVVVAERASFWSALAEDQGRRLDVRVPSSPMLVAVEREDLADVVDVLVDNVFAHTPDGTDFAVEVAPDGDWVVLTVDDAGGGIRDNALVDRGASGTGSSGLGLDIARRAATASGGSLTLGRRPAGGTQVTVRLGRARS